MQLKTVLVEIRPRKNSRPLCSPFRYSKMSLLWTIGEIRNIHVFDDVPNHVFTTAYRLRFPPGESSSKARFERLGERGKGWDVGWGIVEYSVTG
uniref:Uncharacterized protein n=1 Tax=Candidatus Kentrum sp. TC TaxID=2126339 RepID=A0A450Z8J7_9GAMM|nr:MAG: hypothetical protein BECKTC1821D_GA0114238_10922 [Candidatus Kentron sp. TC]